MNWSTATRRAAEHARRSGALAPIETAAETLVENDLTFVVRVIKNLERKRKAAAGPGRARADPFAPPYEEDLWVGDLPPAHAGLLNKFPVLDAHLLAVTRDYAAQTDLLTRDDCEALLRLLHDWNGLAFYNGGREAGASQRHKHLQMVDLPLAPVGPALPVAAAFDALGRGDTITRSPKLPFPHAVTAMPAEARRSPAAGASILHGRYLDLLAAIDRPAVGSTQSGPYNLLATREWLWAVPRLRSHHQGIEINGLGFAGALLVPDAEHRARLHALGPGRCLRAVCP